MAVSSENAKPRSIGESDLEHCSTKPHSFEQVFEEKCLGFAALWRSSWNTFSVCLSLQLTREPIHTNMRGRLLTGAEIGSPGVQSKWWQISGWIKCSKCLEPSPRSVGTSFSEVWCCWPLFNIPLLFELSRAKNYTNLIMTPGDQLNIKALYLNIS